MVMCQDLGVVTMSPVCEDKTQIWTREEIIDSLTSAARRRLGITLPALIKGVQAQEIDLCAHAEIMAVLNLLPKNDPLFSKAASEH